MITGITAPDEGSIRFNGAPFQSSDQHTIGYMPEERGLYKKMKVGEQLIYLLQLKGMPSKAAAEAASHWMKRMDIDSWKNRKVTELSKGMQQKIQFIATIAHNPSLLILDEPFSGLDPVNAKMVEEIIHELKARGTTIIFSTHRMEQVEQLCDQIALIHQGKVVLQGNVSEIRKTYRKPVYDIASEDSLEFLNSLSGIHVLKVTPAFVRIELAPDYDPRMCIQELNHRVLLTKFELHLPSLNDIFIELVSRKNG
jgi:ABC-2 type transport system ATP-binding protein